MNTFDWNWFFAAYAQCGAALIGIISAFIISKLLGENDKYEAITEKLQSAVLKKDDLLKRISNRFFHWHDRLTIEYDYDLSKAIENGTFSGLSDEHMLEKLYQVIPGLFKVEECIDYLSSKIEKVSEQSGSSYGGAAFRLAGVPPEGLLNKLSEEREKVRHLQIDSETLIEEFRSLRHSLISTRKNIGPINNTIYILSLGLFLTVIYPLHFIPLALNESPIIGLSLGVVMDNVLSIKGIFLFILAITIYSIFIYFFFLLRSLKLKYLASIESIDEQWLGVEYYCRYFRQNIGD